jgi:hypothetical protein
MHKKLLSKMRERASQEDVEALADVVGMSLDKMKEEHPQFYAHLECLLYEALYGKVLTEEKAMEWVRNMAPVGQHWTKEETTDAMRNLGYTFDPIEFYAISNMEYNDQYELVKDDETLALKLAHNWLKDKDAVEHKAYEYYKYIAK